MCLTIIVHATELWQNCCCMCEYWSCNMLNVQIWKILDLWTSPLTTSNSMLSPPSSFPLLLHAVSSWSGLLKVSNLNSLPFSFYTRQGPHCCWWHGKQQPSFDHPQPLHTSTTTWQCHLTPPQTTPPTTTMNNSQCQQQHKTTWPPWPPKKWGWPPTNEDEPAPAKTDHGHPHELWPAPTNGNRWQQAQVSKLTCPPTTLSNMESRCQVTVGNVAAKWWTTFVICRHCVF